MKYPEIFEGKGIIQLVSMIIGLFVKRMMLQPTEEEIELYRKLDDAKIDEERKEIEAELKACIIKKREKLKDCLFAHS